MAQISIHLKNASVATLESNYSSTCVPQLRSLMTNKRNSSIQTLRAHTTSKFCSGIKFSLCQALYRQGKKRQFFSIRLVLHIIYMDERRNLEEKEGEDKRKTVWWLNSCKWKSVNQDLAYRHVSLLGKEHCISVVDELGHLITAKRSFSHKTVGWFSANVKHETFLRERKQNKPKQHKF